MSHVSTITIDQFVWDHSTIVEMCKIAGWQIIRKSTYVWYGRHVGDYPIPEGFTLSDMGRCRYAIHIPGVEYELGVVEKNGKIYVMWDFFSAGGLPRVLGRNAEKLKAIYTKAKVLLTARKHRRSMTVRNQKLPDGNWTVYKVLA